MPTLGDYLGHLLSEITIARVQADVESLRIAELYASHPQLRYFPVPHFRLPTVSLDVPVSVREVEESAPGQPARGGIDATAAREKFDALLNQELTANGIRLTAPQVSALKDLLDRRSKAVTPPKEVAGDVRSIADAFVADTVSLLKKDTEHIPAQTVGKIELSLKSNAYRDFLGLRKQPPRVSVAVTAAELKEAGPREMLTTFHLTISEEGFEWAKVGAEGETDRLVPE